MRSIQPFTRAFYLRLILLAVLPAGVCAASLKSYVKPLEKIYHKLHIGLHISQSTLYDKKALNETLRFAKRAGVDSLVLDLKTSGRLTSIKQLRKSLGIIKKKLKTASIHGRWVMFKYYGRPPVPFRRKNGKIWKGENAFFSNPLYKSSWDYNFYGVFKKDGELQRRRGIMHYLPYVSRIELDYIRYPARGLKTIDYKLDEKTIAEQFNKIRPSAAHRKKMSSASTTTQKNTLMASYASYYVKREEFKGRLSFDVIGSVVLHKQNIGQYNFVGKFRVKPMLYLDKLHTSRAGLLHLIATHFKRRQRSYTIRSLYYYATKAYLENALRRYPAAQQNDAYIHPYIKGWHNKGETSRQTMNEFIGQVTAIHGKGLRRFTIWSVSKTIERLLIAAEKANRKYR